MGLICVAKAGGELETSEKGDDADGAQSPTLSWCHAKKRGCER